MAEAVTLPKGIYRDRLICGNGHTIDRGWRSNAIVNRCRDLLAGFMMGGVALGVQFIAVGRGDTAWDSAPTAPADPSTQQLVDSVPVTLAASDPAMVLAFLNAANEVTSGPTNRIQVTVTFGPGVPAIAPDETSYPLREFGLFGRFATEDYMIDYVRHPVINKGPDDTLVRTIRLVF